VTGTCIDAFSYYESVEEAKDGSDMAGFRSFNNGTWERVLGLLEAGYFSLRKVVVKSIIVIEYDNGTIWGEVASGPKR